MCARNECDNARLRRLTTTRTFTCSPSVSRHCRVSCALCCSWFSRCHWCRTSRRSSVRFETSTSFHHAYAIPSTKFFSSGCCSPTLSCHRQLNLYPKFLHISHRKNGSFEVLSLHLQRGDRQKVTHHLHGVVVQLNLIVFIGLPANASRVGLKWRRHPLRLQSRNPLTPSGLGS